MTDENPTPNSPPTGFTALGGDFVPPSVAEMQALIPSLEFTVFIGHGGMGTVYQARQPKLDRYVAVKILPVDPDADAHLIEGFRREAKAMAKLRHPAIVKIYDFGDTDLPDGGSLLYLVMEFVRGDILERLIHARDFDQREIFAVMTQVCDALNYAHEQGVIHRDIRPGNTLLNEEGGVKIGDFGLARIVGDELFRRNITAANKAMRTLDYVAPEQHVPGAVVDDRADIYSVGVMLYKLLTRTLPRGEFVLPSEIVPALDPRADAIVIRCMQTDPNLRYQEITELWRDIHALRASLG